jgi:hypothetical protein
MKMPILFQELGGAVMRVKMRSINILIIKYRAFWKQKYIKLQKKRVTPQITQIISTT